MRLPGLALPICLSNSDSSTAHHGFFPGKKDVSVVFVDVNRITLGFNNTVFAADVTAFAHKRILSTSLLSARSCNHPPAGTTSSLFKAASASLLAYILLLSFAPKQLCALFVTLLRHICMCPSGKMEWPAETPSNNSSTYDRADFCAMTWTMSLWQPPIITQRLTIAQSAADAAMQN